MRHPLLKHLFRYGRFVLAIVPFLWIFSRIHPDRLIRAIHHMAWWTVPALCIMMLSAMTLQGVRWWWLMRAFLPGLRLGHALTYHFAGLYYGMVLPTSAAQDFVRAMLMSRKQNLGVVWGATWICRLLGLGVLAVLSATGFLFFREVGEIARSRTIILAVFGVLCVLVFLSFSKRLTRPVRLILERILPHRLLEPVGRIREGIYLYRGKKRDVAVVLAMTVCIQVVLTVNTSIVIKGISGSFYFIAFLAFMPVIEIISISLPLTPGSIGVRESLVAVLFTMLGISDEQLGIYASLSLITILLKFVGLFFLPHLHRIRTGNARDSLSG